MLLKLPTERLKISYIDVELNYYVIRIRHAFNVGRRWFDLKNVFWNRIKISYFSASIINTRKNDWDKLSTKLNNYLTDNWLASVYSSIFILLYKFGYVRKNRVF